jgi:hypothetical protein
MTSVIKNQGNDLIEFKSLCTIESPGFDLSGDLAYIIYLGVNSPTYAKGPLPFTYNRRTGELDIDATIGGFQETMIDISEQSVTRDLSVLIRYTETTGGHLVQSLGNKFKEFIRSWREGTIDEDSPINIHSKPTIVKVIVYTPGLSGTSGYNVYPAVARGGVRDTSPDFNKYYNNQSMYTTYLFKTPLIFTIVESGVTKYVTFFTGNGED